MFIKKASFKYSLKNIPIPSPTHYMRDLLIQTEKFIQRMRWKAFFFLKNKDKDEDEESTHDPPYNKFGFKTPNNAPRVKELANFESDLNHLIANIEYSDKKSPFQRQLLSDVTKINKSKNIFVKADKTHNVYEVDKATYDKLMRDNVTSTYVKCDDTTELEINKEAKSITEKLKIDDRVEIIAHKDAYITLKDHKPQFPNTVKCRLINPTKSNIGIISKQILANINHNVKQKLQLRQLKNTQEALEWFKSLNNKSRLQFLQLDIVDYYPSVSMQLFNDAIEFASKHTVISALDKEIILNARKSLLCHQQHTWSKNTGLFDITMGAYDGAEITDLVGLYILEKLKKIAPKISFGLYRDDGLGIHGRITPRDMEKIKKDLHQFFNSIGLQITLETHLSRVDFLDVSLDLHTEQFSPYRKPNDVPLYIHKHSNHPPHVIKNLPLSINNRLTKISSSEEIFNQTKTDYEQALMNSQLPHTLKYTTSPPPVNSQQQSQARKKKSRKRNHIYYNPPFNAAVTTKFGKEFLRLVDKNFPKNHSLSKIFNRKTIKISFSCTKNIDSTITAHNKKIINPKPEPTSAKCNCRDKSTCPIPGKCCSSSVVYKASVNNVNYIGMTEGEFKTRYRNHVQSFKDESKKSATTLSQYIWDEGLAPSPNIKWEILKSCPAYTPGARACSLCVSENILIMKHITDTSYINKRSDIGNKCKHMRKYSLSNLK